MRPRGAERRRVSIRAKRSRRLWLAISAGGLLLLLAPSVTAQIASNNPSQILQQYRDFRATWITIIWPYADTLFALLATIEFAWSAAVLALEKTDLPSRASALIRKIIRLQDIFCLALFGSQWVP